MSNHSGNGIFSRILKSLATGKQAQVFIGTSFLVGVAAAPVIYKEIQKDNDPKKRGLDLFSQEKPRVIEDIEDEQVKAREARNKAEALKR